MWVLLKHLLFQIEEGLFPVKSASVTNQLSIGSNNPMTWHDNGDWVRAICPTYCSAGGWAGYSVSDLTIRPSLSIWYLAQAFPHLELELCTTEIQRNAELT